MKRFRYALEPVLLTRQWDLDAQRQALGEHNAAVAAQQALCAATKAQFDGAADEFRALTGASAGYSVQRFALLTRYLGEMTRQGRELALRLTELETERDQAAARVLLAQRAVDAAEQHRDDCEAQFMQQRASADFKLADDQWNMLHTGVIAHDN